jgi:hypothetical protein
VMAFSLALIYQMFLAENRIIVPSDYLALVLAFFFIVIAAWHWDRCDWKWDMTNIIVSLLCNRAACSDEKP